MNQNVIERRIAWGDLDPLGIVFYPRYYEWIDAAGHLFFESLGLPLDALHRDRGIGFGLVETGCRYRRPGRYHQEIRILTSLSELGGRTLVLRHRIEDAAGALLAEGFEKRICLDVADPEDLISMPIPDDIARILGEALPVGDGGHP